jgi:deoxyribodipyrimidine photolyase-related protein
MILGNHPLLTMIDPRQVFLWFMEMFIDSYEWVMVPNVMAMSQYADNSITTKPYVSSSSYIRRMSDYPKGEWMEIWDALFWNFIINQREILENIPRMKVIFYNLDRMSDEKKVNHIEKANQFLDQMLE